MVNPVTRTDTHCVRCDCSCRTKLHHNVNVTESSVFFFISLSQTLSHTQTILGNWELLLKITNLFFLFIKNPPKTKLFISAAVRHFNMPVLRLKCADAVTVYSGSAVMTRCFRKLETESVQNCVRAMRGVAVSPVIFERYCIHNLGRFLQTWSFYHFCL